MPEEKTLTPQEELEILRCDAADLSELFKRFDAWYCGLQPPEGFSREMTGELYRASGLVILAMGREAAELRLRIAVLEGVTG